jgi:hypothetical protein
MRVGFEPQGGWYRTVESYRFVLGPASAAVLLLCTPIDTIQPITL